MCVLDAYAYRTLVWDVFVAGVGGPKRDRPRDGARIAAALPRAAVCLSALEGTMGEGPFLAGPGLTLADLHAAPVFALFLAAPEAGALMAEHGELRAWWESMAVRPSMAATAPL